MIVRFSSSRFVDKNQAYFPTCATPLAIFHKIVAISSVPPHYCCYSPLTLSNPASIFWMASSFPLVLTDPKSYSKFTHRPRSVKSILQGPSASIGNTGPAIINPRRAEVKTTLPNPARPSWDDCCLVTVSHLLACVETRVSKIPHSLWHFLWL